MADTTPRNTGRVKWFNNKAGYGFITWNPTADAEDDIFVHHTALTTEKDQFRYLVEGEYVTFSVTTTGDKTTASDVTGPDGGKLMCETRRERREQNDERRGTRSSNDSSDGSSRRKKTSSFRGGGPRSGQNSERILVQMADQDDGTVWELVRRGKGSGNRSRRPNRRSREQTTTDA